MQLQRTSYDLDLANLRDEELVVLARECGFQPAEAALLERFQGWTQTLIGQLGRRRGLAPTDVEDAAQDAVFGVLKAISRYDTRYVGLRGGCPFQAFLRRVVTDRFKDFVKKLWRYQGRFGKSVNTMSEAATGTDTDYGHGTHSFHDGKASDPVRTVEWRELMGRCRDFVGQLDDTGRGLVDGLMDGLRLRVIADHLRISYDSAKRRRRQLLGELATRLGESAGLSLARSIA